MDELQPLSMRTFCLMLRHSRIALLVSPRASKRRSGALGCRCTGSLTAVCVDDTRQLSRGHEGHNSGALAVLRNLTVTVRPDQLKGILKVAPQ